MCGCVEVPCWLLNPRDVAAAVSVQWGPVESRYLSSLKDCCTGVVLQHVRAWAHALFLSVFCRFFTLPQFLNSSLPVTLCSPHNFYLNPFKWGHRSGTGQLTVVRVSHSRMGHKGLLSGSSVYLCQHWLRGFTYRAWAPGFTGYWLI